MILEKQVRKYVRLGRTAFAGVYRRIWLRINP